MTAMNTGRTPADNAPAQGEPRHEPGNLDAARAAAATFVQAANNLLDNLLSKGNSREWVASNHQGGGQ